MDRSDDAGLHNGCHQGAHSAHSVQFYESDEFLVESVTQFMAATMLAGGGGIVIATAPHRLAIEQALINAGVDVPAAVADGAFVSIDAEETLSRLLVEGMPAPALFQEVIGGVVERMAKVRPRIHAFGEMVSLLWEDHRHEAALRLEALWDEFVRARKVRLLCAYPLGNFTGQKAAEQMSAVYMCHEKVIPAESFPGGGTYEEQARAVARLQQRAHSLGGEVVLRLEAEQAQALMERETAETLENAAEGIHQVSPEGVILWANRAQVQFLGYERHEFVGRPIAEFHFDRVGMEAALESLRRGEAVPERAVEMRCKDGSAKPVLARYLACLRDGKLASIRGYLRDLTDSAKAKQVNARLAAIVDSSDDAIVGKTLEGVITSWNAGAERVFGYTQAEAVGRSIMMLLPPGREREEQSILARLRRGERVDHFETQRVTKEGRIIDVSVTVSPIRDGQGRVVGASKIARDITERRKSEQALRELNAALEQRVEERTAVIADQAAKLRGLVSEVTLAEQRERRKLAGLLHDELAQCLALAKMKLTMLEAQSPENRGDETFGSIKEILAGAIHFTRSLMNDLSPPLLYDMGLSAAVLEFAARFREQTGLEVAVQAKGSVVLPYETRNILFQCVRELLVNVVKYAKTSNASVRIEKNESEIDIVVEDHGVGFDLGTLPSTPGEDRGFGLFSIRERVKLLGGTFQLDSAPGKGTRCRLYVPLRITNAAGPVRGFSSPEAAGPVTPPGAPRPIRLVIADDHQAVRQVLVLQMRDVPEVEIVGQATNGAEALEFARRLRPDIMLLDISLPDLDGIEVARRLRIEAPEVRIIGLSMFGGVEAERMCEAGAVAFLSKDCERTDLLNAIRTHAASTRDA